MRTSYGWLIVSVLCFWSFSALASVPGDVTGDGSVDVSDVQCTVLSSLEPTAPACLSASDAADMNCDGSTDVVDVQLEVLVVLNFPNLGVPADKDSDLDNVHNDCDNCPNTANADQADADHDGVGDACDSSSSVCGNDTLEDGEECDDGNLTNGDGCDEFCVIESGGTYHAGDLIITEVMFNPKHIADGLGEWFEVRNASGTTLSLNGWHIKDNGTDDHTIFDSLLSLAPGATAIFAISGNTLINGGVIPTYVYADFTLDDDVDEIIIVAPDGTLIDTVAYGPSFPLVPGRALSLSPAAQDPDLNDNPSNWCVATMLMTSEDYGTPGFINNGCSAPGTCGNNAVEAGEECDDGNTTNGDGCDSYCQAEPFNVCGNSQIEYGETCDDGNTTDGDGCSSTCQLEGSLTCGNNSLDDGEECDDGNNTNGDGCDQYCMSENLCGNGNLDYGEQCDDGNPDNGDGCSAECILEFVPPVCGDGNKEGGEECDDGNLTNGDGCSSSCLIEQSVCGDGTQGFDEECDDGNTINEDGCNQFCSIEYCGDNLHQAGLGEQCDDGNLIDGDGCDSNCQMEGPPTGISGVVSYSGTVGSSDVLYILIYTSAVTDPVNNFGSPTLVLDYSHPSFPFGYEIPIDPGTYYVAAVLDVGGNGAQGFTAEDIGGYHPGSTTVPSNDWATAVDFQLGNASPGGGGTVKGTITCYSCGISSSDALYLVLTTTEPPTITTAVTKKVKPISISLGKITYEMTDVPAGTYWVGGYLDYDDNSPSGPTGDDKEGYRSSSFSVSDGQTVTSRNFTLY